jgi:TatD DNase family protein
MLLYFYPMNWIDTHTHLYLEEFDEDRAMAVQRATGEGVSTMLLPNIDHTSWQPMLDLCTRHHRNCFAMAGLHPTSVLPKTYESELSEVTRQLENGKFVAVGEIGIDLYWDKTHLDIQEEAFIYQVRLAKKYKLPVAIHVRKSFDEVWRILKSETDPNLKGVFHCFPGDENQARLVIDAGFMLGIGGVVTFKNSHLQKVVAAVGPESIVLETDAPFLAPAPFRGKRNEPSYIPVIGQKVAELCGISVSEVAEITTKNAQKLFGLIT